MNKAMGWFRVVCIRIIFSAIVILSLSAALGAQQTTGRILGTILDSQGSAVPNAQITVTNQDTGAVRNVNSGDDGLYNVPQVEAGKYTVEVKASGFGVKKITGAEVVVATDTRLDVKLDVGSVEQSIAVTEAAPLVDTTSSSIGGLVSEQRMADLPLNGRNWTDLTLMQPGVVRVVIPNMTGTAALAGANGTIYSSNGGALRSNFMSLDGANMINLAGFNNSSVSNTSLGVDGIKEYKVVTNMFSAEYGLSMGSQTTIVSKGGSNQWHGDAFEYFRNSSLDARNYFDNVNPATDKSGIFPGKRLPPFHKNNFGGAFGGPVKKDKTFFYAVYEGVRERLGVTTIDTTLPKGCFVDTNNVLQAKVPATINNNPATNPFVTVIAGVSTACTAPTGSPQTNATITVRPLILPIADLYPQPNAVGLNYNLPYIQPTTENYGQIRADQNFSAADTAFLRYTVDIADQLVTPAFLNFVYPNQSASHFATIGENHVFSPVLLNTARFSYSRTFLSLIPTVTDPALNVGTVLANDPTGGNIAGAFTPGGGTTAIGGLSTTSKFVQDLFTWSDDVFLSKGKHAFKFGTLINHYVSYPIQYQRASLSFGSLAAFFSGTNYSSYSLYTPTSQVASLAFTYNTFGFYAQDDYRVNPRLTLNLGLRYEIDTVPVERESALRWSIRYPLVDTTATPGNMFRNPSLHNFSPRVGFAWDVFGTGKTAVKGGGGIYYDVGNFGQFMASNAQAGPPIVLSVTVPNTSANPATPLTIPLSFPAGNVVPSPRTADYNLGQPTLYQWNMTVQQQLPWRMGLVVSYIGSRGVHQYQVRDGNPTVTVGTDSFGLPVYGCWNPPTNAAGVAQPRFSTPLTAAGACPSTTIVPPSCAPAVSPCPAVSYTSTGPKPNGVWNTVQRTSATGDSTYNSVQTQLNKQLTSGLQFQFTYTYSKLIDDGQGLTSREGLAANGQLAANPIGGQISDRGVAQFDVTHNARANFIYHAPDFVKSDSVGGKFLNGWWFSSIISAQGGYPITISLGSDRQLQNNAGAIERPNVDPTFNASKVILGTVAHWFDTSMFDLPAAGTLGNMGRGLIRGPGFKNLDFSAVKDTKLHFLGESGSLQFRAEFFNIFNHPNFSNPNLSIWTAGTPGTVPAGQFGVTAGVTPSATAGQITSTTNNARQVQFALKVIF